MSAGIPYDSREARAIAGAIAAMMTGISYATSAEMAETLGAFPRFEENRERMLRVIRNHRRAAYGETEGYERWPRCPWRSIIDAIPDKELAEAAQAAWDEALSLGHRLRLSQRAGHRDRANRHHRPGDGLRHHRRRTRFRAGEIQEAGGRRLFQDHQPLRARSAAHARLRAKRDRRHHRLCGRPRHAECGLDALTHAALRKRKGFGDAELDAVEHALEQAFDIRFVFNKWTLGEAFCVETLGTRRGRDWTRPISTC